MDCCLLVHTCDHYSKFWKGMTYSLEFNWDYKKIPVYWSSEQRSLNSTDLNCRGYPYKPTWVKQILVGKTDKNGFSDRMIKSLEKIPHKWVIYIQEDMWLLNKPNFNTLEKLLLFADAKNVDSIKIHSKLHYYDRYFLEPTNHVIDGIKLLKFSQGDNYLHSHNATIWNKEYLLKHLVSGEDPWTNEENGSKRMSSEKHEHYHYNLFWYVQPGVCDNGVENSYYWSLGPIFDNILEMKFKFNY